MARTVTRTTPEQDKALDEAAEAAAACAAAQAAYRSAVLAAWDSGVTKAALAARLGVTGESVRRYLQRNGRPDA